MPPLETSVSDPKTDAGEDVPKAQSSPVTPRAMLLGIAVALLICAITPYNDSYVAATYLSGNFFPIGALGAILLLTLLVNPLLIGMGQRTKCFSPGEIITVWSLVIVSVGIPSSGLMRYLIPHLPAPVYYASASNGWKDLVISHLPARLLVTDPDAARTFFEGLKRGQPIPWDAWTQPLLWWGLFALLLFSVFFCLSALLRRQWVEHERFSFPLVQLPVLLAEAPEPGQKFNALLRSRLLWIGFGVVTALHTVKGLHQIYPTIPDIVTVVNSADYLTNKPWNGLNNITVALYPLVIGFAYLLASEVSLSFWLFYLVFKVQVLMGSLYNWDMSGVGAGYAQGPAFAVNQEAGGAIALVIWLLWAMRAHLRVIWRKAIYNAPEIDDAREPLSYRTAFFGLIAAYAGLFVWLTQAAQMQASLAVGVLVGSFVIFVMLSWMVAQAGLLFMQQAFAPSEFMTTVGGSALFDVRSLTMASLAEQVGWRDAREFMMPSLLNADKGAAETGLNARSLTRALALCVLLAMAVSAVAAIWLPYTHGGGTALKNDWTYISAPQRTIAWAAGQAQSPRPPQIGALVNAACGAALVILLFVCRSALPWFGLHPAGFLVAATYPMYTLWFSLFLGWLAKLPIVRYGGMKGYRAALPFFMGLILGDCVNALGWVIVGLATGKGYKLLPT